MKINTPTLLVLDGLAVYRLTRLVTLDTITAPARRWASGWQPTPDESFYMTRPMVYEFLTCPWCVSVWIAAAVAALTWAWPTEWAFGAAVLAFSAVAGFLQEHER